MAVVRNGGRSLPLPRFRRRSSELGDPVYLRRDDEVGVSPSGEASGASGEDAGLHREGQPDISCHDLRHTFASILIRSGLDVYSVSRQLGHSKPSITLDKYAAEFEKARNSEGIRDRLQSAFGGGL